MFFRRRGRKKDDRSIASGKNEGRSWPQIDVTIDELKKAVQDYHKQLPAGVSLSVLVEPDNRIDYSLLAPFLQGIPRKQYYMSKETFEIFDEPEIPRVLDQVQRAVDQYIQDKKAFPIIDGDPYFKISYFKLADYLDERPSIDTYLTEVENMITHKKPEGN